MTLSAPVCAQPPSEPESDPAEAQPEGAAAAPTSETAPGDSSSATEPLPVVPVADDPQATPSSAPAEGEAPTQLDDITVTATRRAKSAREIPVSVDAFDADALNRRGAQGAQDALLYSPGVSVNSFFGPNFATVQVRGTTVNTVPALTGSATNAFLDDIPLGSPTTAGGNPNIDSFDLEVVEVLKGPQGTLFGGSALAGALRSTPRAPELALFSGGGFYSHMSVSDSEGTGADYGVMFNAPLGEHFAVRGVAVRRTYPGAVDNTLDELKDVDRSRAETWRGMLRWEPADALALHALYHEGEGRLDDSGFTDNPDRLERGTESGPSPLSYRYRIAQLKADYSFGAFTLAGAAASVRKTDMLDANADHILGGQTPTQDAHSLELYAADIRTQELRAVSAERTQSGWFLLDQWDWLLGLFDYRADQYGNSAIVTIPRTPPGEPVEATRGVGNALAREQAVYFDLTRYLGQAWELNLGGRLFRQELRAEAATTSNGAPVSEVAGTQEARRVNPKLAVTWHATGDLALRAAAIKGFRFGGVNLPPERDPNVPPFYDTDELWNYELGARSDWFDRRLRIDLTGFFIDWERTQINQRTVSGLSNYTVNIGSAVSRGGEAQIKALLPGGFTLILGGAYTDARTAADFESANGPIASGTRLPGTPYVTGSAVLDYSLPVRSALLAASLTATHQGRAWNTLSHQKEIPAYEVFGASLGLALPTVAGQPSLSLNAANLSDRRAYSGAFPPPNGRSAQDYFPIRPRTVTLQLGMSF